MSTDQQASDLELLQREYRHMEQNRKAYAEESHQVLRKQQQSIDKLRRDNDALKTEIAMQMRTTLKPANSFQQSMIEKLHDQMDKYSNQIETEKNAISVMDEQIAVLRDKVLHQRKMMGGVNAARDNQHMIQKQIRILENRLDKALVKFNQSLSSNRKLREQIDDLRRERVVFDNIYKKLEKELHEKKKQMANVIELSNMTYEQRDNCQMEITAIDQANRKEQEDFEEQMIELGRMLEQDFKLQSSKSAPALNTTKSMGGKDSKKGKKIELSKTQTEAQHSMERVQNFEEAFNKIRAATGISDIEELVRTFIKNEDQNFSLFNYVNEQTNEIEKLEETVLNLRKEESKYNQLDGDEASNHKTKLKELEKKLQVSETMAEKYEGKCNNAQTTIESLKKGIKTMFEKLGCRSDMLADASVTEANMLQFLGIIEQRTNEILSVYHTIKSKEKAKYAEQDNSKGAATPNVLGLGPTIPMGQDLIHVNPPKLEEFSSDEEGSDREDEATKPLTREELKTKTLSRVAKSKKPRKESNNGQGGGKKR